MAFSTFCGYNLYYFITNTIAKQWRTIFFVVTDFHADKASIKVCICSYCLKVFMHKFRMGSLSLSKWKSFFLFRVLYVVGKRVM